MGLGGCPKAAHPQVSEAATQPLPDSQNKRKQKKLGQTIDKLTRSPIKTHIVGIGALGLASTGHQGYWAVVTAHPCRSSLRFRARNPQIRPPLVSDFLSPNRGRICTDNLNQTKAHLPCQIWNAKLGTLVPHPVTLHAKTLPNLYKTHL